MQMLLRVSSCASLIALCHVCPIAWRARCLSTHRRFELRYMLTCWCYYRHYSSRNYFTLLFIAYYFVLPVIYARYYILSFSCSIFDTRLPMMICYAIRCPPPWFHAPRFDAKRAMPLCSYCRAILCCWYAALFRPMPAPDAALSSIVLRARFRHIIVLLLPRYVDIYAFWCYARRLPLALYADIRHAHWLFIFWCSRYFARCFAIFADVAHTLRDFTPPRYALFIRHARPSCLICHLTPPCFRACLPAPLLMIFCR